MRVTRLLNVMIRMNAETFAKRSFAARLGSLVTKGLLAFTLLLLCKESFAAHVNVTTGLEIRESTFDEKGPFTVIVNGHSASSIYEDGVCDKLLSGGLFGVPVDEGRSYMCTITKPPGATPGANYCGAWPKKVTIGTSSCWESYINGEKETDYWFSDLPVEFMFEIRAKTNLFKWRLPKEGRYRIAPDPTALGIPSGASPGVIPSEFTWEIAAGGTGCTIQTNTGVISGCDTIGSITVSASKDSVCYEEVIEVRDCNECGNGGNCVGGPGSGQYTLNSVDARFDLGWGLDNHSAGFLQIKEEQPFTATPARLQRVFPESSAQLTNKIADGTIAQVRAPTCLVDVVTSNSYTFRLQYYRLEDITGTNKTTGLYTLSTNPGPFSTFIIENPSNDTNQLRVTQTRDGGTSVFDYTWLTNGWELASGNGLRKEVRTETWSETNTLKTVTNQIKSAGGTVVWQSVQKYRVYSYGQRMIEEITGTGSFPITNTFAYTTNGLLEQVVRNDGSWEFYRYDTNGRPINVYSGLTSKTVTTNINNCRMFEHIYATNVVSGSGDYGYLDSFTPRRTIEYALGQEVGRKYFVALPGERREYVCTAPGVSWDFASNLVTVTKLFTNGYYKDNVWSVCYRLFWRRTSGQIGVARILRSFPHWRRILQPNCRALVVTPVPPDF